MLIAVSELQISSWLLIKRGLRARRGRKVAYEVAVGLHCLHELRSGPVNLTPDHTHLHLCALHPASRLL